MCFPDSLERNYLPHWPPPKGSFGIFLPFVRFSPEVFVLRLICNVGCECVILQKVYNGMIWYCQPTTKVTQTWPLSHCPCYLQLLTTHSMSMHIRALPNLRSNLRFAPDMDRSISNVHVLQLAWEPGNWMLTIWSISLQFGNLKVDLLQVDLTSTFLSYNIHFNILLGDPIIFVRMCVCLTGGGGVG